MKFRTYPLSSNPPEYEVLKAATNPPTLTIVTIQQVSPVVALRVVRVLPYICDSSQQGWVRGKKEVAVEALDDPGNAASKSF
jgi:hypothetical protein